MAAGRAAWGGGRWVGRPGGVVGGRGGLEEWSVGRAAWGSGGSCDKRQSLLLARVEWWGAGREACCHQKAGSGLSHAGGGGEDGAGTLMSSSGVAGPRS